MFYPSSLRLSVIQMRERLCKASRSPQVQAFTKDISTSFALTCQTWEQSFTVHENVIEASGQPAFTLAASDEVWQSLMSDEPPAGRHSLVHLVRIGEITVTGDTLAYHQHVHLVRALIESTRLVAQPTELVRPLTAVGTYSRITTSLGTSDVYVERSGSGPVLLAFATAGSDTSQWHGLITNSDLTDRFTLITVDLPWHGKSSPAWGASVGSYQLTPETYTEFIVAVAEVLGLGDSVLVGVSMGGAAVVHAVATHPEKFKGAVACQAGPSVKSRKSSLHRSTNLNTSLFVPEWTYGLMNPASPEEFKQRVWWGYSSGGYGLYAADIDSYSRWDFALVEDQLTSDSPHIAVLSGAFDTSVPSERSRELAARIPNSSFTVMPELGHFPHAENPAVFAEYLERAITRVLDSP
jgi:pimeloyl-ACP methyl ester carboxylesterase